MPNNSAPAVSVVIPTYNHAGFVLETLASVFAQTFADYEVIVVNDGSPDATADVLRPLAESGRIRYLEQANAGQAAARNRGIAEARGEFIALLDDDDVWPADKLDWQVAALRQEPDAVMVCGFAQTYGCGPEYRTPAAAPDLAAPRAGFAAGNWVRSPGQALLRRAAVETVGRLDPALWGSDDWDLYLRLVRVGRLHYEDRPALHYRQHAGNASRNHWRMYTNSVRVYRKNLRSGTGAAERRAARRFLRRFGWWALDAAAAANRDGRWGRGAAALLQAAWMNPALLGRRAWYGGFVPHRPAAAEG